MNRRPAVAGQFYPGDKKELEKQLKKLIDESQKKEKVIAAVSPHAGYIYSGMVAGSVYSRIQIPENVIIIGPNHSGIGAPASLMAEGEWEMPFGNVQINTELSQLILEQSQYLRNDAAGHLREHSLEVQVPFLQYLKSDFSLVPISLMRMDCKICEDAGNAIAQAIKQYKEDVLIVASTDMSHYLSHDYATKMDRKAIDEVLALNPKGLYDTVKANDISMCGFIPTTIALIASKLLGAKEAELVDYRTSAEVSGDYKHVVGYAGLLIK
jgi:AmmeMemoRadiSam system protein B